MSQRQFRLFPERRDERRATREAVVVRFDSDAVTARMEKIYLSVADGDRRA